uniref:Uncharacterized protein n=1 Tax=Caenorhabditis japonica TaxID=281687 RepID=A0A8R1EJ35_CAEJA
TNTPLTDKTPFSLSHFFAVHSTRPLSSESPDSSSM